MAIQGSYVAIWGPFWWPLCPSHPCHDVFCNYVNSSLSPLPKDTFCRKLILVEWERRELKKRRIFTRHFLGRPPVASYSYSLWWGWKSDLHLPAHRPSHTLAIRVRQYAPRPIHRFWPPSIARDDAYNPRCGQNGQNTRCGQKKAEQPASKGRVWFSELGLTVVAKSTSYTIHAYVPTM